MTPPIFVVCEDGDVLCFVSVAAAEAALESPDVESGEYTDAFDATGARLQIEVPEPTKERRLWFGITSVQLTPVKITPSLEPPDGGAALRRFLTERLEESPSSELPALVERASVELARK